MWAFAPAVIRGDASFEFPRPILACRLHDSWDYLKLKVPRQEGDQITGMSRDGVDISIEGQFGSMGGSITLSEEEMLEAVDQLRQALHVEGDDDFELALFQDANGNVRSFRQCVTTRLDVDFSNPSLFTYSAVIHAADPVLLGSSPEET